MNLADQITASFMSDFIRDAQSVMHPTDYARAYTFEVRRLGIENIIRERLELKNISGKRLDDLTGQITASFMSGFIRNAQSVMHPIDYVTAYTSELGRTGVESVIRERLELRGISGKRLDDLTCQITASFMSIYLSDPQKVMHPIDYITAYMFEVERTGAAGVIEESPSVINEEFLRDSEKFADMGKKPADYGTK